MNMDESDFILTEAEIASAQRELGLVPTELGVKLPAEPAPAAVLDTVQSGEQSRFGWTIGTLSAPAKRVLFHYSVGNESLTRSIVAWDQSNSGEVATLALTGQLLRIATRTAEDLVALSSTILAAEAGVKETPLSLGMSPAGLLTWLALVEQLQALELSAMLRHHTPMRIFNRADLEARLAGAIEEDFRWPLMFFTKVLPGDLPAAFTAADVDRGIDELAALELVEASGNGVWEMTPQGDWLVDEMLASVSKVGCGIAAYLSDGTIGYRTLMFVRTPRHLILHLIEGDECVIATVSAGGLERFLVDVFDSPEIEERPTRSAQSFCEQCGTAIHPDDLFCANCGNPLTGGVS